MCTFYISFTSTYCAYVGASVIFDKTVTAMFEDDDMYDEDSLFSLLALYEQIKNGTAARMMGEEEYEQVIEYFFANGQEAEALLACDIASTYHPFSSEISLLKAELLSNAQKYGQALNLLDEIENAGNRSLDSVLLRADIYVAQGKYDQSAALLEEQSHHFEKKEKIELLLELSDVYDEAEEYEAVFDTLCRVIEVDTRNEEALQKICFWAEFAHKLEESVQVHQRLTDKDPYNALAWFNLGAAFQSLKLYERAIDAYEFCIAIDEKFEFAYRNMADAYMRIKWYEKALDVLERHLEIAKPEDVIFEAMGYCWEKKKNFSRARYYYRQASQLNPQDDTIFYKIGETYSREQQWDKAVKAYSVALHLNKENAGYCMAIGNCLMEMDVTSEALVCYLNAVRLKPNNKTTWLALIRGLLLSGHFEEALTQIAMAEDNCGEKAEFYYYQAAGLIQLGKTKEGLLKLEEGLQAAPSKMKLLTNVLPDIMRRTAVAELVARYKKGK